MAKYLSQFKYLTRFEILTYHNLGVHKYLALSLPYRLSDVLPATISDVSRAADIITKYLPVALIRY
jgi:pyruvate formate lyase activating enzyme